MKNWMYVNKYNEHKFLEVRRYADGHYVVKQSIRHVFDTCKLVNYVGSSLRRPLGTWHRMCKSMLLSLLEDYAIVEEVQE